MSVLSIGPFPAAQPVPGPVILISGSRGYMSEAIDLETPRPTIRPIRRFA